MCRIMWSRRDPGVRRSGSGNVFVKNLDRSINNKALYDTFSLFGNILSCKVSVNESGKSNGYGFVHYDTEEAAQKSIALVNGMQIGDRTVFVGKFQKSSERTSAAEDKWTNLYIKDIPSCMQDEQKLYKFLAKYGDITSLVLKTDPLINKPYAFCNFEKHECASKAVTELHGKIFKSDGTIMSEEEEQETKNARAEEEGKNHDKRKVPSEDEKMGDALDLTEKIDDKEKPVTAASNTDQGSDNKPLSLEEPFYVQPHQSRTARTAMLKAKRLTSGKRPIVGSGPVPCEGGNLYIKNFSEDIDDDKLRELFEPFGTISSAKVMRDEAGVSRGFGFVCFVSPDEGTKAVSEMHLRNINGKPIYVGLAEKREERQRRLRPDMSLSMPWGNSPMSVGRPPMLGPASPNNFMQWRSHIDHSTMPVTPPAGASFPYDRQPTGAPEIPLRAMAYVHGMHQSPPPGVMNPMTPQHAVQRLPGPPFQGHRGGRQFIVSDKQVIMGGGPIVPHSGGKQPQQAEGWTPIQPAVAYTASPLSTAILANAPPPTQKQMLGEKLFPLIARYQPDLAGKITGMMLEMDNAQLVNLLECEQQLRAKVNEAVRVLQQASVPRTMGNEF
eukprot:GHVT01096932.1.p2 GENE.GHVT01096932.1~~GHVT01096932.1.p2  ORF type:complete len:611 (+),score=39.42 GHVT01096932.1:4277-6109(+)